MLLHLVRILRNDDLVRAEAKRVILLVWRSREDYNVRPERKGNLNAHMTESTETDPAYLLALAYAPVAHRRVSRDSGAKQRSSSGEIEVRGHAQDKPLVDHDTVGVAAIGDASQMFVGEVVGKGRIRAELLEARHALRAGAIGVDHAADGSRVAGLELGHRRTDLGYAPDNFVPRNTWIDGGHEFAPLVADLVEIGVTNAAIQNFDLDILFGWLTPGDHGGCQRRCRAGSGIGFHVVHALSLDSRRVS